MAKIEEQPGRRFADAVSLGVLARWVPRDEIDAAVVATGKQAKRKDGKLPPHVMVYFTLAMALFADDDYEGVLAHLAGTLASWPDCWDAEWEAPGSGGIAQARQRLGSEPLRELFSQVAAPVTDMLTPGAFLGSRRLVAVDGMEWDVPDTPQNAAFFGYAGSGDKRSAFPKVRVVALSECASHAYFAAAIGGVGAGEGSGEQSLAATLWGHLDSDMLLLADRNFYSFANWCDAQASGAQLLWRVKSDLRLPVVEKLPDGSYTSVLVNPGIRGKRREALIEAARDGQELDPGQAALVRVIEYTVPDRDPDGDGELICLITTILDIRDGPAATLAEAYHQRWEHETGNDQIKTHLRGPGRVLRSKKPDLVLAEIYGYLLTHYALSALICEAATEAQIDPDRVKFTRTVRIVRRHTGTDADFPP
ncbi:IS4 family transposase [Sphaerimonospora cavernae]|uniref:IS4 family transposase n=1 Tax=Sphaerimonospora cavernae TaxID=1740611 RepID=A0ABV6UC01_9ACTN